MLLEICFLPAWVSGVKITCGQPPLDVPYQVKWCYTVDGLANVYSVIVSHAKYPGFVSRCPH